MTISKRVSYKQYRKNLEKFPYVVEIPCRFYFGHCDKMKCWIDANNRDFYVCQMKTAAELSVVKFSFVDPDDCFDFKVSWL